MLNKKKLAMLCVAGALMVFCGTASAQGGPVGSLELGTNSLSIMPAVPYAELGMTISGEGVYLEEKYGPGGMAAVYTGQLPDGQYSYEIIASPEVDEAAMEEADGDDAMERELEQQEKAQTYIQSGNFEVVGGEIQQTADPETDPSTQ